MAKKSTPRSEAGDTTNAPTQPRPRTRSRAAREVGLESGGRDDSAAPPLSESYAARGTEAEQWAQRDDASTTSTSMGSAPSEEDIRMRAYHRYLERGGGDGMHFEDWLEAERELRERK